MTKKQLFQAVFFIEKNSYATLVFYKKTLYNGGKWMKVVKSRGKVTDFAIKV